MPEMFSPRVPDSHMDWDCCGHSGKCLCIPNTCSREGGEVAVTAKCPCPLRQTEAQGASGIIFPTAYLKNRTLKKCGVASKPWAFLTYEEELSEWFLRLIREKLQSQDRAWYQSHCGAEFP